MPHPFVRHSLTIFALLTAFAPRTTWSQGRSTPLRALIRPTNDFAAEDDTVGTAEDVPEPVTAAIDSIARAAYDSVCVPRTECESVSITDFYGAISRIRMRGNRSLYVFHEPRPFGGWFFLIIYRPDTRHAVTQRFSISGYEMETLADLRRPTVVFQDVDGSGSEAVGFEEAFHHGTDDFGYLYRFYSIDGGDHFHPIIATETYLADSVVESTLIDSAREDSNAAIVRSLTVVSPNHVRLDSRLERPGRAPLELGYAILARRGPGNAFTVAERHPNSQRFNRVLLTFYGVRHEHELLSLTLRRWGGGW